MEKRIFIFEGADGVGKDYIINLVESDLKERNIKYKIINQPSDREESPLAFIRDLVKYSNASFSNEVRQFLHTCSHIVDYERIKYYMGVYDSDIKSYDVLIFNRSFISSRVYSIAMNIDPFIVNLLQQINVMVFKDAIQNIPVSLIHISREAPFRTNIDDNYKVLNFNILEQIYRDTVLNSGDLYPGIFDDVKVVYEEDDKNYINLRDYVINLLDPQK